MGHIVYCWENGASQGHIVPARPILAELRRRGHTVSAVLKDLRPAEATFDGLDIGFYQAPQHRGTPPPGPGSSTLAWQLAAAGFRDPTESAMAFQAWRSLFRLLSPDFALLDYSPLAALALSGTGTRTAQFGTGICCPPGHPVVRPTDSAAMSAGGTTPEDQRSILATLNHHLRSAGGREFKAITDLIGGLDETFLTTYPELDHYAPRAGARYWGVWADPDAPKPEWPASRGRRAFAYLHWFKHMHVLFDLLNSWEISTVVYGYGMPESVQKKFSTKYLRLETRRVSLPSAAEQCDFAITHGNHGSTAYLLGKGVPLFMLPLQTEMESTTRRVTELGAGRWAPPGQPDRFARELGSVALGESPKIAAMQLAKQWSPFESDASPGRIADRIEELMRSASG